MKLLVLLAAVTPLFTLPYDPPPIALSDPGGIAFTESHAFFGTDDGLYRAPLPLGSAAPELIAFDSRLVTHVSAGGGVVYVALDVNVPEGPLLIKRSLFRSEDEGETWEAVDEGLEECHGADCRYLQASQVQELGGRIFTNAGGNVLASGDGGATWSILFGASSTGKPQAQACYDPTFTVVGRRLLIGGECPLDTAYLISGTLTEDLLHWEEQPVPAVTPWLENRNVQFIRHHEGMVYAGIEGALLRSNDQGASYDFLLRYEGTSAKYPYITHIAFPVGHPNAIVTAGFDKAAGGPFLAVSTNGGATWRDESHLLPGAGDERVGVGGLAQSPAGELLLSVEDDGTGLLSVFEVSVPKTNRRRPVRH